MMELVIKIDENVFTRLFDNGIEDYTIMDNDLFAMVNSIRHGTPLPKGHGRLIDADALIKQLEAMANNRWNIQVGASKGLEEAIDIVDDAQTIIEANKTESDGEICLKE